jgi:hypothetical protein
MAMQKTHKSGPLSSYRDFWPYYLREHAKPRTRAIHIAGTLGALGSLALGAVLGEPLFFTAAPLLGYGPAWYAHFFVERNRPATFTYPLWSLISDFRMCGLWLAGRLGPELERAGLESRH